MAAGLVYFYNTHALVPILMYHHIDYAPSKSNLYVSPEIFERQMEFLKVHGYHVVPLESLVRDVKAKKKIPGKTVAITFDDGFVDNMKYAFPILKKMDFPATIFMITENINKEDSLSEEDLRVLDDEGVTIGSHTVTHAYLPHTTSPELINEIFDSKKRLEEVLGHPISLFSYPAGGFTDEAKGLVEKAGYSGAVTTNHGNQKNDVYALHRVKISESNGSLFSFWLKTSGLYHLGKKRVDVQHD